MHEIDTVCRFCAHNTGVRDFYMLPVWVIDDMKFIPDVFAGMMPCIANGTAIHDPNDPCHTSRPGMGMSASSHDMSLHEGMSMGG